MRAHSAAQRAQRALGLDRHAAEGRAQLQLAVELAPIGEIQARSRRDLGEIYGRYRAQLQLAVELAPG